MSKKEKSEIRNDREQPASQSAKGTSDSELDELGEKGDGLDAKQEPETEKKGSRDAPADKENRSPVKQKEENGEDDDDPLVEEFIDAIGDEPEKAKNMLTAFFSSVKHTGPIFNPIYKKVTENHITIVLKSIESSHDRVERSEKRHYRFLIFLVVVVVVVFFLIILIFKSDMNALYRLLTGVGLVITSLLGGIGIQRILTKQ